MYKSYENDKILVKTHPSPRQRAAEQLLRGGGGKLHLTVRHITADSGFGEGVGLQAA